MGRGVPDSSLYQGQFFAVDEDSPIFIRQRLGETMEAVKSFREKSKEGGHCSF
ncbi:MAG: hypothetical protein ACJAVK_002750 [Akkermansiaceae bacterium]|jgi:hypothetical protein